MQAYLADLRRDWMQVLLEVYLCINTPLVLDVLFLQGGFELQGSLEFVLLYPFIFVGFMGMVLFFAINEFGPAAALVLIPPLCLYGIGLRRSKPARVAGCLGLMSASGILLSGIISV